MSGMNLIQDEVFFLNYNMSKVLMYLKISLSENHSPGCYLRVSWISYILFNVS